MQIPSFMCSGTMVIELREFNNKKKKNKMKIIIWPDLVKYLVHRLLLTCSVLLHHHDGRIDLKLKARSECPNVWGEYKNNP